MDGCPGEDRAQIQDATPVEADAGWAEAPEAPAAAVEADARWAEAEAPSAQGVEHQDCGGHEGIGSCQGCAVSIDSYPWPARGPPPKFPIVE